MRFQKRISVVQAQVFHHTSIFSKTTIKVKTVQVEILYFAHPLHLKLYGSSPPVLCARTTNNNNPYNACGQGPPGGGLPYITDGDACRNFQKKPLKVTIGCGSSQFYSLKVTSGIFIHRNSTGILKIIAKRQQVLRQMNGYITVKPDRSGTNQGPVVRKWVSVNHEWVCFLKN